MAFKFVVAGLTVHTNSSIAPQPSNAAWPNALSGNTACQASANCSIECINHGNVAMSTLPLRSSLSSGHRHAISVAGTGWMGGWAWPSDGQCACAMACEILAHLIHGEHVAFSCMHEIALQKRWNGQPHTWQFQLLNFSSHRWDDRVLSSKPLRVANWKMRAPFFHRLVSPNGYLIDATKTMT